MRRSLFLLLLFAAPVPALATGVLFVDNSRPGGLGTLEKPFAMLAQAQAASREGDIIYVAEGNAPYEGGISLQRGQMLIGAAYGLDAAAADFHMQIGQSVPAVQGPGPTIHGTIWLGGGNVVAGCTVAVETGTAINSNAADSPVTLRKVFLRPTKNATGLSLQAPGVVSIQGGGIDGATIGGGLMIAGGTADVTVEHVPISGSFGTAVGISSRRHGKVAFRSDSPLKVDAAADAVQVIDCVEPVAFGGSVQIVTHGGRGMFVSRSNVSVTGGNSSIDATGGAAVEIHDSSLDVTFNSVASTAADNGMILDKVRGKFAVTGTEEKAGSGGTVRNARTRGLWLMQSSGIRLSHMMIADSGNADAACSQAATNVQCHAAVYLGHVSGSAFDDIAISGGAAAGLNANNIVDLTFSALQISGERTGPAAVLEENSGAIVFSLCKIAGATEVDQRFNSARVLFDRCALGRLRGDARNSSRLEVAITSSALQNTARPAMAIGARDSAAAKLSVHDSRISGGGDQPSLSIDAADDAALCVDLTANSIVSGGAAAQIAIGASPHSTLHVVAPSQPLDAAIAQANGGARVTIDARGTIAAVSSCAP